MPKQAHRCTAPINLFTLSWILKSHWFEKFDVRSMGYPGISCLDDGIPDLNRLSLTVSSTQNIVLWVIYTSDLLQPCILPNTNIRTYL